MQALQADTGSNLPTPPDPFPAAFAPAKLISALVARQHTAPRATVASLALCACSALTLHGHLDVATATLQIALHRFDLHIERQQHDDANATAQQGEPDAGVAEGAGIVRDAADANTIARQEEPDAGGAEGQGTVRDAADTNAIARQEEPDAGVGEGVGAVRHPAASIYWRLVERQLLVSALQAHVATASCPAVQEEPGWPPCCNDPDIDACDDGNNVTNNVTNMAAERAPPVADVLGLPSELVRAARKSLHCVHTTPGDARPVLRVWQPFLVAVDTLLRAHAAPGARANWDLATQKLKAVCGVAEAGDAAAQETTLAAVRAVLQVVVTGALDIQQLVGVGLLAYEHLWGSPSLVLALLHVCRAVSAARMQRYGSDAVPALSLLRQLLLQAVLSARPRASRALCRQVLDLDAELEGGMLPAVAESTYVVEPVRQ